MPKKKNGARPPLNKKQKGRKPIRHYTATIKRNGVKKAVNRTVRVPGKDGKPINMRLKIAPA